MKKRKIVISGGHLTPAVAVIEELNKDQSWEIFYLGRKKTLPGSKIHSREMVEISKLGISFTSIPAGKFSRHYNLHSLIQLLMIPWGFFSALLHLLWIKPDIILSFGGYVALPITLAGKLMRLPIVTHEQTTSVGLANRIIARFSDAVAVSWPHTDNHFKSETVLTGNPIRKSIIKKKGTNPGILINDLPLIYITGGNQGSHAINQVVVSCLLQLSAHYRLAHQCGLGKDGSDYQKLQEIKDSLPEENKSRYLLKPWFNDLQTTWLLKNSDLVISRSGANIITELLLTGTKSILIPLPVSGAGEQISNALLLKECGIAQIIYQSELNSQVLQKTIATMLKDRKQYAVSGEKSRELVKADAAQLLVKLINEVYEKKGQIYQKT